MAAQGIGGVRSSHGAAAPGPKPRKARFLRSKNAPKKFFRLVCAFVLFFVSARGFSQDSRSPLTVRIDQIISGDFPDVRAYAVVEDARGEVVAGLSPGLFGFRVDSLEEVSRASITPFSLREEGVDYSVLVSAGGVMEGEPLDFQKTALFQFMGGMREADRFSLYTIGEEAAPVFEEMPAAGVDPARINSLAADRSQPRLYDSLIGVLRRAPRRGTQRKAVIVISDGRDQGSRFTREQLGAVLAEAGVPVYAIGIRVLGTQSLSNLNEIADLTGGSYIYARNLGDIPASLKRIHQRITQSYVIDLRVRSVRADGLTHTLELTIDERDAYGKGAKTFTAVIVPVPAWVKWAVLAAGVLLVIALVLLHVILRIRKRRRLGITRRRCPDCGRRMKDSWDFCPFCKYLGCGKKKKRREKKGDA